MIHADILDSTCNAHLSSIETDGMTVFVAADGLFRGALFHGTHLVHHMRAQHNTGILETFLLGQAMLCGALIIPTMKGRETVQLKYETDGAAQGFCVEACSEGSVRGYLLNNPIPIAKPPESWDLSPFLGNGTLRVTRLTETAQKGSPHRQTGFVEIKYHNIAQDLAWYFQQSEQLYTAFHTSIQFNKEGHVIGAGGLFMQRLPAIGGGRKADETSDAALVQNMERAFSACPPLGTWFSEGGNSEDIIYGLFREFAPQTVFTRDIIFDCPCSPQYYARILKTLPKKEIENLKNESEGSFEVVCKYCSSVYHIDSTQLDI